MMTARMLATVVFLMALISGAYAGTNLLSIGHGMGNLPADKLYYQNTSYIIVEKPMPRRMHNMYL